MVGERFSTRIPRSLILLEWGSTDGEEGRGGPLLPPERTLEAFLLAGEGDQDLFRRTKGTLEPQPREDEDERSVVVRWSTADQGSSAAQLVRRGRTDRASDADRERTGESTVPRHQPGRRGNLGDGIEEPGRNVGGTQLVE